MGEGLVENMTSGFDMDDHLLCPGDQPDGGLPAAGEQREEDAK